MAEQPDQENYDVWLMGRPFVMVAAEEHTAQVPGEIRNKIENDFKSANGRTNCLVATPTLELGVNIGALDMALMRNVPPKPSNYWQRAGRAGREERMAAVVTYCRRSPHDRYFFDDPLRLLGGTIEAPTFNLRNPLMVAKHIRSAILSELLLRSRVPGESGERIKQIIKTLFPFFIRTYLVDEDDHYRETPTSTEPVKMLLNEMKDSLADRLLALFAQHWPAEASELASRAAIEETIAQTADALESVIRRLHRRLTWALSTRAELHRQKDSRILELEEEQLLRRCDEFIRSIMRCDQSTYTLTVLGVEGFLPGYGVYEGGITASAQRGFPKEKNPLTFDWKGAEVSVRCILMGDMNQGEGISVLIDVGELMGEIGVPVYTYRNFPRKPGLTVQQSLASLGRNVFADVGIQVPNSLVDDCVRLCCSLCLLENDPSIISPDVLADDRAKYEASGDQKYVEKAHRRGKVGWDVGRSIEVIPHYRRPHMALVWTGHGRVMPKIVPRRGSVVHREAVEKLPSGFGGG